MDILILVITCVINLSLGAVVLWRDRRAGFARSFAAMSLIICLWIIANYVTGYATSNLFINDIANKIAYVSGYSVVLSGLVFTYLFPVKRRVSSLEITLVSIVSSLVIGLSLTYLVAGNVSLDSEGKLAFSVGPLLWFYVIGYIGLLVLIGRNSLSVTSRLDKKSSVQARLVLIAFYVSALTGILLNSIIPILLGSWSSARFGPLATILLVATIVYAIAKHGLFDIRLAAVRTMAYILSLCTLAAIYYFMAFALSGVLTNSSAGAVTNSPLSIGLALLLAFFFQPVKQFFDRVTNKFFYKDNYNVDDFFARLNRTLTSTTDLRILLEKVATEVGSTLKSEQAFFFINTSDGHYLSAGTSSHKYIPKKDTILFNDARTRHGVVVGQLLYDSDPIRRMMISHRIELVLPLKQASETIGYLCLGYGLSSSYTQRDMKLLSTISDELVIAIENALSVQEIRNLNETLQQRVNEATKELRTSNAQLQRLDKAKDEFVSMASHQLRTPLTSVKGYISMVLEGDAGKITDAQEHLLGEAFTSSERMVHLINDFLNVSRLQTGKFFIDKRPVDLAKVVEQELDSLATNASSRNLKFIYKSPKNFPILNLDEGKMRQVIMNFADNAIFYSGESTEIKVSLSVEADNCMFTVKDTGIGVPRGERAQLFSKFYRASNARKQRPDGTGVGLFLAKKVITAHGGEVIFESAEGKGSTFGFSLPIEPLRASDDADQLVDKPNDDHND